MKMETTISGVGFRDYSCPEFWAGFQRAFAFCYMAKVVFDVWCRVLGSRGL